MDDAGLAAIAAAERRILLSRDRGLLKRKIAVYGYCVRTTDPRRHFVDGLQRFTARDEIRLWQRCLHCNGERVAVENATVYGPLEPKTQRDDGFSRGVACGPVDWHGAHVDALLPLVDAVLASLAD